jgi:hypothetical protein
MMSFRHQEKGSNQMRHTRLGNLDVEMVEHNEGWPIVEDPSEALARLIIKLGEPTPDNGCPDSTPPLSS